MSVRVGDILVQSRRGQQHPEQSPRRLEIDALGQQHAAIGRRQPSRTTQRHQIDQRRLTKSDPAKQRERMTGHTANRFVERP